MRSEELGMRSGQEFIEMRILGAVRRLLAVRVNEILGEMAFQMPLIDFGNYEGDTVTSPAIALSACERTEKERIIRLDAYSVAITFTVPETLESETHCYAYAFAVDRAFGEDASLGGVASKAIITGKKYNPPKRPHCGEGWEVVITARIVIEGNGNAG